MKKIYLINGQIKVFDVITDKDGNVTLIPVN